MLNGNSLRPPGLRRAHRRTAAAYLQDFRQELVIFPEGRMSKLAKGKLARLLHRFSNKCPCSIIVFEVRLMFENEVPRF